MFDNKPSAYIAIAFFVFIIPMINVMKGNPTRADIQPVDCIQTPYGCN
jgi:hypothetical protein